ncbi:MAG: hypothetical protein ABJZ69_07980, partial [Hyphomicrobiales bacterium]
IKVFAQTAWKVHALSPKRDRIPERGSPETHPTTFSLPVLDACLDQQRHFFKNLYSMHASASESVLGFKRTFFSHSKVFRLVLLMCRRKMAIS